MESTWTAQQNSKASTNEKTNDLFAIEIEKAAKYHIGYIMFQLVKEAIEENKFKDQNASNILQVLLKVYALKFL